MTLRQKAFVSEYLIDLNATEAAKRAGYSPKTAMEQGYQLLQKPSVKAAIEVAITERAEKLKLDAEWVLTRLKDISDRCMQAKPVLDKEGNPTGEFRFDAAGANRATELIGKHLSMFTDKIDTKQTVNTNISHSFSGLTDEELDAKIAALEEQKEVEE